MIITIDNDFSRFDNYDDAKAYCEKYCPQPYNSRNAAIWAAKTLDYFASQNDWDSYDLVQTWICLQPEIL